MKKTLVSILFGATLFAFAACGGGASAPAPVATPAPVQDASATAPPAQQAEPSANAQQAPDEVITINFWHSLSGVHFDGIQNIVDAFHEYQDRIRVEHIFQGNPTELHQSVLANAMAGTLPHIGSPQIVQITQYINEGFVLPLDPFMADPGIGMTPAEIDDIITIFRQMSTWDDVMYSVPFGKSTRVLFYNRDMLDAAGLDVPATWAEILSHAEAMTTTGVTGMAFENAYGAEFQALLAQHGGTFINEQSRTAHFGSEAGIAAMSFLADLVNSPYGRLAGEDGFMSGVFGSHGAAMYIGSSAGLPHVAGAMREGTNWGTAPSPTLDGYQSVQFSGPDAVLFNSPNHTEAEQRAAWEFLRFTLRPEITAQWAADSGYIPVRYSAVDLPLFVAHLEENPRARAANEQFENGFFPPRLQESSQINTALTEQQELIMLGIIDVATGLQIAEDEANRILGN